MNYLICFLLAMVVHLDVLAASTTCSDGAQKMIGGKVYAKKLKDGEQVFGVYTCLSCGERTSGKPDTREVKTHCEHCNAPHTTEPFTPPAYFRVTDADNNTNVYVVDPEALVEEGSIEDQASRSGKKRICPHCGGSHFSLLDGCPDCGGSLVGASKLGEPKVSTAKAPRGNPIRISSDSGRSGPKDLGLDLDKKSPNQPERPTVVQKVFVTKKGALYGGGGVLGAAVIIYWTGNYNYQTKGSVVTINEAQRQVTVSYVDYDGAAQRIVMDYDVEKASAWYLTEEITLYFVRWPEDHGAERMNGEVYSFELPQRVAK